MSKPTLTFDNSRVKEIVDAEFARGDGPKPMAGFLLLVTAIPPQTGMTSREWVTTCLQAIALASGQPRAALHDMMVAFEALVADMKDALPEGGTGRDGTERDA